MEDTSPLVKLKVVTLLWGSVIVDSFPLEYVAAAGDSASAGLPRRLRN
jgi:hypothetical protein